MARDARAEQLGDERRGQLLVGPALQVELDLLVRARAGGDPCDGPRPQASLGIARTAGSAVPSNTRPSLTAIFALAAPSDALASCRSR
jgi:hypothetical protein